MANPNPKTENLTNMGKGRPKKNLTRFQTNLDPELIKQIKNAAESRRLKINAFVSHVFEEYLCG
jgi:predicted HicB family RNase H-like nuclease